MATRNIFAAVVTLLVVTLACGGGPQQPNFQATIAAAVNSTQAASGVKTQAVAPTSPFSPTPTLPLATVPGVALTQSMPAPSPTPCEAARWSIIPLKVITLPSSDQGFKYILIPLAIGNDSPYWGRPVNSNSDSWYVTTEGGFTYQGGHDQIETGALFPYASYYPHAEEQFRGTQVFNNLVSFALDRYLFPPGYVLRGSILGTARSFSDFYFNAGFWSQMLFRVAETQNHFVVTIPSISVVCVHPDGQSFSESSGPIVLDLDKDVREAEMKVPPYEQLESITTPLKIADKGIVEFLDISRNFLGESECQPPGVGCVIIIHFKFTNASTGYEASDSLVAFILGDDGLLRAPSGAFSGECSAKFSAGPGKSSEFSLCFYAGPQTNQLRFVWLDGNVPRVYKLPQ